MSDAVILGILTLLGGAIGAVWRDMTQRLEAQAEEIRELRQANADTQAESADIRAENVQLRALYVALYVEVHGQEPDIDTEVSERIPWRNDRRKRPSDRRKTQRPAIEEASDE